jgi:hypothetical protein
VKTVTNPSTVDSLRTRERLTAEMVLAIDDKIRRLSVARADRARALQQTRSDLASAILAGPVAPERHEKK